jgi:phospho-2-dehydro-3-deoxyheptonate aldolase
MAACEYLDTITPQFIADLVSWAMVGPRSIHAVARILDKR